MTYDAVRVDDVYDSFIKSEEIGCGREEPNFRERLNVQITGLAELAPLGTRKVRTKAEPQKSPAEMDWMRD